MCGAADRFAELAPFSPDARYPNEAAFPFNGAGVQPGFMFQPMRVPMFSCRDAKTSELILSKALDNRARLFAYPQWGAQLNAHMDAGGDAATCMRRGFCQPLGGQSVWAARNLVTRPDAVAPPPPPVLSNDTVACNNDTMGANNNTMGANNNTMCASNDTQSDWLRGKRPIVLLSAAFDSQSMFQDEAVGARSEMAALTIALATLDALVSSNVSAAVWNAAPRQPLFAFFTGEAWNQMGSKQFFRDVAHFDCKLSIAGGCLVPFVTSVDFQDIALDNVAYMMHLSSDLGVTAEQRVFWHVGNVSDTALGTLVREELALSADVRAPSASVTSLPPSALAAARRHRPSLPGVVLGGFDDRFNARYHSRLDDARGANTKSLCSTASAVARAFVAALLVNDTVEAKAPRNNTVLEAVAVNCTLVDALWHCLVEDALCDLVRETLPHFHQRADSTLPRPTHYVGVHSKGNVARDLWSQFISAFAASRFKMRSGKECTGNGDCAAAELCVRSACVYANVHFHDALPDGLAYYHSDGEYVLFDSGDVWVESNWDTIGLRLFKRSAESSAVALLVFGVLLTLGSFVALVLAKKKAGKTMKLI